MKRYWLIGFLGVLLATLVGAKTLEHDLGRGLVYMRITQVPDDLPVRSKAPAIVIDLRYANGDDISEWLTTYAAPQTPIFVLANTATQKILRQSAQRVAGSIIIGIASGSFTPDIVLDITDEEEKNAYDALTLTKDINTLLYPTTQKERYDEAAMLEARDEAPNSPQSEVESDEHAPEPLLDQAILRAVQIHRGWLVLCSS